jgi:hypothetical protein
LALSLSLGTSLIGESGLAAFDTVVDGEILAYGAAGRQCRRPSFNEAGVTEVCGGSSIVKFNGEKGLIVTVFLLRIE